MANKLLTDLEQVDCWFKFISLEPLLGPVHLLPSWLKWVIVGGITDTPDTPPMRAEWAVEVAELAERLQVPFFFKSWGQRFDKYTPLLRREFPKF